MQLIEDILTKLPFDVFSDAELATIIENTPAVRHSRLTRALAKGVIIQLRRGLYCMAEPYRRQRLNPYELAQRIYGPSYVSFESAFAYHNLIPEAVYCVASASAKRAREFSTPLGMFTYTQIPPRVFAVEVERIVEGRSVFLMASPLKAIVDYVYTRRLSWQGLTPLVESLRMEESDLIFKAEDIDNLEQTYQSPRVSRFLTGLKKDLSL